MTPDDDLVALFAPPLTMSSLQVRWRQGQIMAWDPVTASNVIRVDGVDFADLPILNTSEALLLRPGDVVSILVAHGEGSATYAILGRMIYPNTPAAASALSAIRTYSAEIATRESTTSGSYTDLATAGPEIQDVLIGPSGRCLVTVGALIEVTAATGLGVSTGSGAMGFTAVGPTTVPAAAIRSALAEVRYNAAPNSTMEIGAAVGASRTVLLADLTPGGLYTFTARYLSGATTASWFSGRNLTVIPL